MKVEVDVLGLPVPNSPHGLCGRKATLNSAQYINASVAASSPSPSLISLVVSVDVKHHVYILIVVPIVPDMSALHLRTQLATVQFNTIHHRIQHS